MTLNMSRFLSKPLRDLSRNTCPVPDSMRKYSLPLSTCELLGNNRGEPMDKSSLLFGSANRIWPTLSPITVSSIKYQSFSARIAKGVKHPTALQIFDIVWCNHIEMSVQTKLIYHFSPSRPTDTFRMLEYFSTFQGFFYVVCDSLGSQEGRSIQLLLFQKLKLEH